MRGPSERKQGSKTHGQGSLFSPRRSPTKSADSEPGRGHRRAVRRAAPMVECGAIFATSTGPQLSGTTRRLFFDARIGCSPTRTKMGFVCAEPRIRNHGQLCSRPVDGPGLRTFHAEHACNSRFIPHLDEICTPSLLDQSRRRRAPLNGDPLSGLMRMASTRRGSKTRWISSSARVSSAMFAAASSRSRSASLKARPNKPWLRPGASPARRAAGSPPPRAACCPKGGRARRMRGISCFGIFGVYSVT